MTVIEFADIILLILDVDGVLTDGGVALHADSEAFKRFHVHDGSAVKLWQRCGGTAAIVSGRPGGVVEPRAAELGIRIVRTGVQEKLSVVQEVIADAGFDPSRAAYVGDDWPDLEAMAHCGFAVATAGAVPAVKRAADYVTRRRGGDGAVAEVVELLLRKKGRWSASLFSSAR